MNNYIKKNRKADGTYGYGKYAKQWIPSLGHAPGGDSLYQYIDPAYNEKATRSVNNVLGEAYHQYNDIVTPYSPDDRKNGDRTPGLFRPVLHKPSSGRILWIHVNPDNHDKLMVVPDGAGIFRTDNGGKTWDCITDRIPNRRHRNYATHSAIPCRSG